MLLDLGDPQRTVMAQERLPALLRHANNPKVAEQLPRDQFPYPDTRHDGIDFLDYARTQDPECSFAVEYGGEVVKVWDFIWDATSAASAQRWAIGWARILGQGSLTRAVTAMSERAFEELVPGVRIVPPTMWHRKGCWRSRGLSAKGCCGEVLSRMELLLISSCLRRCGDKLGPTPSTAAEERARLTRPVVDQPRGNYKSRISTADAFQRIAPACHASPVT